MSDVPYLPQCVVTLVHGTWAREAAWTRPGSPLIQALTDGADEQVHIDVFQWSGRNTHSARVAASQQLVQHVRHLSERFPKVPLFLVAHSHGGNVCMYAINDDETYDRVRGVVTISTPFLCLSEVEPPDSAVPAFLTLGVGIGFLAGFWCSRAINQGLWNWFAAAMIGAMGFLLVGRLLFEAERSALGWSIRLRTRFRYHDDDLLLVRSIADEASLALAVGQFAGWLASKTWDLLDRVCLTAFLLLKSVVDRVYSVSSHQNRPRDHLAILLPGLLVYAGATWWFWETIRAMHLTASFLFCSPLLLLLSCFAAAIAVSLGFLAAALALFALAGTIITPLAFLLVLLSWTTGPELSLAVLNLQLTVEASPPGAFRVLTFVPSKRADTDPEGFSLRDMSLRHSVIYEDWPALFAFVIGSTNASRTVLATSSGIRSANYMIARSATRRIASHALGAH